LLAEVRASLSPAETLRWADELVTAFASTPTQTPAETKIAGEVRAVQEALEAIAAGQNERALAAVRPLARDSVFSHWKMFVKALAAFHSREVEKALRCFDELPLNSAPGRARVPYLLLLGRTEVGNRTWPETTIETVGRLAGHGGWGRLLARAQSDWLAQRYVQSYKVLRDAVSAFPGEGLNPVGILSEFFFNAIFTLPESGCEACEDFFLSIETHSRAKNAVELMLIRRTFCLLIGKRPQPAELKRKWEAFLGDFERLHGANPHLTSLGYGWLGEILSESRPQGRSAYAGKPRLRDAPGAIDALKKCIALYPANLEAHLNLCAVYAAEKMTSERNRLLDSMTARFPERKEVLVLAGAGCLDRDALLKGLDYLEKALQLDRLDPAIPDLIVAGLVRLARQYFEKRRPDQARQALQRAEEFLIGQPENFLRNPWCHLIRRGLLEQLHGDVAQSTGLLAQARAASPFPAAFLFFAKVAGRIYTDGTKNVTPFHADFAAATDNPNAAHGLVLVRAWLFWQRLPDCPVMQPEEDWLRRYLNAAVKNPFTRDEARPLVELLQPRQEFHRQAEALVKRVLKEDEQDPFFRLYQHLLQPFHLSDPMRDRETLGDILREATRRGDEKAVQMARELRANLHAPPVPAWNEEPEEFERDADNGPDDFRFPAMSPKDAAMMAEVLNMLAGMSEKDLKWARKQRPKGMPAEIFELLIAAAQSGPMPPLPPLPSGPAQRPSPPLAPPCPPPPPIDPNQLDLF
ncbi:MAG: hypothetical protein L0Z50_06300, partial [Verrucomicrobiales bacterium]|nr:hypothetical protein [Verrucomicrobiales bacterium]